ncbi:MAG: O-antigen ligase family protein, partial [Desulfobacula sp.]
YGKIFLWGIISLLALFNVVFMVGGRTGHLVIGVLFVYYFVSWGKIKGLVIGGAILLFLVMSAWFIPSNPFFLRAKTAIEEIKAWEYGKKALSNSSSGLRLEFYSNSLKIIKENPFFGNGTGSFEETYRSFTKNTGMNPTDNPHNEYLMTVTQFGFVGLAALLGFFLVQWLSAGFFKENRQTTMARGLVLTFVLASMVSSPLQDHADGWFFALMSAFLFAGPDTRQTHEKKVETA